MARTHWLWARHVGEACLSHSYAQTNNRGIAFIALAGVFKLSRTIGGNVRSAMASLPSWLAPAAGACRR